MIINHTSSGAPYKILPYVVRMIMSKVVNHPKKRKQMKPKLSSIYLFGERVMLSMTQRTPLPQQGTEVETLCFLLRVENDLTALRG